jgi:ubiquinone/menaquinone biosynthesis C-methylase UbiE
MLPYRPSRLVTPFSTDLGSSSAHVAIPGPYSDAKPGNTLPRNCFKKVRGCQNRNRDLGHPSSEGAGSGCASMECAETTAMERYYLEGREASRLFHGQGQLERARTQELLQRYLPPPRAVILDVGGGAGVYACWLAKLGYQVHLIDPVPLHVEQAGRTAHEQGARLAGIQVGDARHLDHNDRTTDAVLLLGPLYHLTEPADRRLALAEAVRVLQPGGLLFAAGISRFASLLDGLHHGFLHDPAFQAIVERDLREGQHRNPTDHPGYFTTAYFHHPDELRYEVLKAGLQVEGTFAVEGAATCIHDFEDWWDDPARRSRLLAAIRAVEQEPSLLGVSPHLLVVARKAGVTS